jgi:1-deoxy-D-xylulose-5-phosphate reductoisomerase
MIILGSTGSIGVNALIIAKKFGHDIEVLTAGKNIKLLNEQINQFNPKIVVVQDKDDIENVNHDKVLFGLEGILEAINISTSKLVVNSLVGFLGLKPTIESIKCGKKVALANKESLVVAGKFVDMSKIIPIDSEHFGLWYLLNNQKVEKMTITASGGSFRDTPLDELKNVTIKQALNHPNWSMGKKITIDSATMVNKLFELIEAKWLFDCNNLDAIIETKSIIHAVIDFIDGSSTAHIANTNMQLPISFAINEKVEQNILPPVDLLKVGSLEFKEIQTNRYPIWQIKDLVLNNLDLGVVFNAINEVMVYKFLDGKVSFLEISKVVLEVIEKYHDIKINSLEEIFQIDKEIREKYN